MPNPGSRSGRSLPCRERQRHPDRAARLEEKRQADQLVQRRQAERKQKLTNLEQARRRNPLPGWRPSAALSETLAKVGQRTGLGALSTLSTQADELRQTLSDTGEALRRAGPLLGPLVSFALSRFDVSAVSNVIASASAVLAGLTAYAAHGSRALTRTLTMISTTQTELNADLDARRAQLDEQVHTAELALADTERALESAIATEDQLATQVADLKAELARRGSRRSTSSTRSTGWCATSTIWTAARPTW